MTSDVCYESAVIASFIDKCSFLDPRFKVDHVADKDLIKSNLEAEIVEQCYQLNNFQSTTNIVREEINAKVAEVIKPLSVLTDALPGEKEVTSSAVQPILKHVVEKAKRSQCNPK